MGSGMTQKASKTTEDYTSLIQQEGLQNIVNGLREGMTVDIAWLERNGYNTLARQWKVISTGLSTLNAQMLGWGWDKDHS